MTTGVGFYQTTGKDTIAMWVSNVPGFNIPIVLSTAVGRDIFLTFNDPPENIKVMTTLNGTVVSNKINVIMHGELTFNPQSTALIAIRAIYRAQNNTGVTQSGILSITHVSTQIQELYRECIFTSPVPGANVRKSGLDDIKIKFQCLPPDTVSLGGIINPLIGPFIGI